MKQWFVVYTQPQKEMLAQQHLKEQGFEVYVPRFKKTRRHARKVDQVLSPLFPRYVFVSLDISKDAWRCVNGTRGVSYIITQDNHPIPIATDIIEQLKEQEDQSGLVPVESLSLFKAGDWVEITEGPFKGQTAMFDKMTDKDRVQLLLHFLGRDMKISVSRHGIHDI